MGTADHNLEPHFVGGNPADGRDQLCFTCIFNLAGCPCYRQKLEYRCSSKRLRQVEPLIWSEKEDARKVQISERNSEMLPPTTTQPLNHHQNQDASASCSAMDCSRLSLSIHGHPWKLFATRAPQTLTFSQQHPHTCPAHVARHSAPTQIFLPKSDRQCLQSPRHRQWRDSPPHRDLF